MTKCVICKGTGKDDYTGETCLLCEGKGEILELTEHRILCPYCKGHGCTAFFVKKGKIISFNECHVCHGKCSMNIPEDMQLCPTCDGYRYYWTDWDSPVDGYQEVCCEQCDSKGYIPKKAKKTSCPECNGNGRVRAGKCLHCNGKKIIYK